MIFALIGQTASGKSSLGLKLAKKYNGIIINADAFQVYKGMDIGTSKPSKDDFALVPHYLYDIFEPTHEFSIYEYQKLLRKEIDKHQDKNIFLVGGSGLYLKAALYDFTLQENSSCDLSMYDKLTNDELYEVLKSVDEEAAKKTHANNRKRVLRALEIFHATGKKKTDIEKAQKHIPLYNVLFIGYDINREILYDKINKRVDQMVEEGLFNEVNNLINKYDPCLKAFQAIGYKEIIKGIEENISKTDIIGLIKKNTRNYAKRQLTYFKNQMEVHWIKNEEEAFELVNNFI